jgi:hypothetical protein
MKIEIPLMLMGTLLVPVTACTQARAEFPAAITAATSSTASSENVTRTFDLSAFTKLELSTSGDIVFIPTDGEVSAVLTAPGSLVDDVEVYVSGEKLVFRNKVGRKLILPTGTKMTLTVKAPMVQQITLNGSGDVKLQGDFNMTENLKVLINGSGDVKFPAGECGELSVLTNGSGDVEGKSLKAESISLSVNGSGNFKVGKVQATKISTAVKGSGDVELKGSCDEASFTIVGSGNVKAESLEAKSVSVKVVGSGDVRCYATETLSVNRIGSGTIGYKGSPSITGLVKKGVYKL